MHPLIAAVLISGMIRPMGPDAPAREPQLAVSGLTVALTFGAGHAIYLPVRRMAAALPPSSESCRKRSDSP